MKQLSLLIIAISTVCTSLHAQDIKTYNLPYCLQTGIERNLDIHISRNNAQIAKNNATRAAAGMTPTVDLNTSYDASMESSRTKNSSGDVNRVTNSINRIFDASVDLGWTLFDGYGMQCTLQRLRELQKQGELHTRQDAEQLMADITTEYYNVLQQELRLKNYQYAVTLSRERMRIAEARYLVGKGSRLDFQQASVDFNADSSQYLKQKELISTSRIRLNQMMNVENIAQTFQIKDTLINLNNGLDHRELHQQMVASSPSLLIAASEERASQADLRKTKSNNYPYLRLKAGYGYSQRAYSKGATRNNSGWGPDIGITVGFNLFDKNNAREERNARLSLENAQLTRENALRNMEADLLDLWQAYQNNLKVVNLEQENLKVAESNYSIAHERFLLGQLSGIEMREAQKSLLDASERLLTARYTTKVCEISLMHIAGRINEYLS